VCWWCASKCPIEPGNIRQAGSDAQKIASELRFDVTGDSWPNRGIFTDIRQGTGRLIGTTRQHSALRHCLVSGLLATRLKNCACSACVVDSRDMYQYLFGDPLGRPRQSVRATQQALYNDREGRACAKCSGPNADMPPATPKTLGGRRFSSEESIMECCRQKLIDGQLATDTTMLGDDRLPRLPERGETPNPESTPPIFRWP
jgi:hypothetical protein